MALTPESLVQHDEDEQNEAVIVTDAANAFISIANGVSAPVRVLAMAALIVRFVQSFPPEHRQELLNHLARAVECGLGESSFSQEYLQ